MITITLKVENPCLASVPSISKKFIGKGTTQFTIQIADIHNTVTLPFIKMRCFIGDATIKKRSMDIEVIDINDTPPVEQIKNCKIGCEYIVRLMFKSKKSKHNEQSETERFITRYVPEFLKHFRGSLTKATRSKTFETTPRIPITIPGTEEEYENSLSMLAVVLITANDRQ